MSEWYVYLIRTQSHTIYCGITKDLERRFKQHASGKGAKYLRSHPPLKAIWIEGLHTHSSALRREIAIKKLNQTSKLELTKSLTKRDQQCLSNLSKVFVCTAVPAETSTNTI